ncbi:pyridoxal 5'-phosphate synthase [Cellulomonas sp. NS3]|uniref:pyridoxal 5'-phosphate synthase n=1 Tax=Cellulomonas sp. NS3 TaxID=2973977 RepID=UPI002161C958|nr:pyridoxal 5'-phosphate synthase [Cellulomonas sp. NS3]
MQAIDAMAPSIAPHPEVEEAQIVGTQSHTAQTLSGDQSLVLPEFDQPPTDPLELLGRWIRSAEDRGVREPRAATLATTDGRTVSSRTILVKDVADGRILFGTQLGSRKGHDLGRVPHASLTFYWRETLQQLNVSGPVSRLSDEESDVLFAGRTREAQAAASVSEQTQPLADETVLRRGVEAVLETPHDIARPAGWAGFALVPEHLEFWHGRADRMHRRLAYARSSAGWRAERLQP